MAPTGTRQHFSARALAQALLPAVLIIVVGVTFIVLIAETSRGSDTDGTWGLYVLLAGAITFMLTVAVVYHRFREFKEHIYTTTVRNSVMVEYRETNDPIDSHCAMCSAPLNVNEEVYETPHCGSFFHGSCYERFQERRDYGLAWKKAESGEGLTLEEEHVRYAFKDICPNPGCAGLSVDYIIVWTVVEPYEEVAVDEPDEVKQVHRFFDVELG